MVWEDYSTPVTNPSSPASHPLQIRRATAGHEPMMWRADRRAGNPTTEDPVQFTPMLTAERF
jgi:hypothetical protein